MSKMTTINFHGTKLIAVPGDKPETTFVAMKPIVEGMGLDWGGQHKKMLAHPVLCKGISVTEILSDGGAQATVCLTLDLLNFWLATIHPDRIKDQAVRTKVIEYQTECARVLFNHFFGRAIAAGEHLDARQTGGIIKAGLGKMKREMMEEVRAELSPLMDQIRQAMLSYDPTASFTTDFRPMLSVLKEHKVPSKGRRSLSTRCSTLCTKFLQKNEMGGMIRISRETGRRVFKDEGIKLWLAAGGSDIILNARDAALGQAVIKFPKSTKPNGGSSK